MLPKLTEDQMAEVFELRNKGVSWDNISQVFGVSSKTLQRYFRLAKQYGFSMWNANTLHEDRTMDKLELENRALKKSLELQTATFRELFDELVLRLRDVERSLDDLRTIYNENNYPRKSTRNKS